MSNMTLKKTAMPEQDPNVRNRNFLEIPGTDLGVLLGHGNFLQRHVSHFPYPPYLISALPMASMRQVWVAPTSASRSQ